MLYRRGFFAVGLVSPRDDKNVAAALRACGCFGAAFLSYTGQRYSKSRVDTQKAYRHMPLFNAGDQPEQIFSVLPYDCVPVAVEIAPGAQMLETYTHPERALYIFGPEDGSIPSEVLDRCETVVRIGSNFCLNLAMAVNVVLYDRNAKRTPNCSLYENGEPIEAAQ